MDDESRLAIVNDDIVEGPENFRVSLSSPSDVEIDDASTAIVWIDGAPRGDSGGGGRSPLKIMMIGLLVAARRLRAKPHAMFLPLFCALFVLASSGCDGRSTPTRNETAAQAWVPPPPPPPPPPPTLSIEGWHGHLYVHVGDSNDDGLLTADGLMRISLWDGTAQFVGRVNFDLDENRGFGTGVVIGQLCAARSRSAFCDEPASAEITLTATRANPLVGDFQV
jgi:hypothetical protein